jgi:RNA polymerase sigma-70 factor (ECF subfamily)
MAASSAPELTRLLMAHRDGLYAYAMVLAGDPLVAEEVFQELSVAILKEGERGVEVGHFLAWARTILRHCLVHYYRREERHRGLQRLELLGDAVERAFARHDDAAESETRTWHQTHLRSCLQELSPKTRQLVDLRYATGLSIAGVAERVAWQADAVRVGLSRAKRILRDCVERRLKTAGEVAGG